MPGFPWSLRLDGPQSSKTRAWSGAAVCTPSHVREPHPTLPAAYSKPSAEDAEAESVVEDGKPLVGLCCVCRHAQQMMLVLSAWTVEGDSSSSSLAGNKVAILGRAASLVSWGIWGVSGTGGTRALVSVIVEDLGPVMIS